MDNETIDTWYKMPVTMQISNIGSEVARAIRWKNKDNTQRMTMFCEKAVEFLQLSISDPKNENRKQEFEFCIEELKDYFFGENKYNTTEEKLMEYYDAYLYIQ